MCRFRLNPRLRAGGDSWLGDLLPESVFQSTPPRGRRLVENLDPGQMVDVSIHASAREATRARTAYRVAVAVSIHASAREATEQAGLIAFGEQGKVSIHASAREATPAEFLQRLQAGVSIHASAREATLCTKPPRRFYRVSIHASAREATFRR